MKTLNLTKKEFSSLERYVINRKTINTEATLYIMSKISNRELLKKFYVTEGPTFSNKLYTINELINIKEEIDIPELILPNRLAMVGSEVVGFTMDFVPNNINMEILLSSPNLKSEMKINYLKNIGYILQKVEDSMVLGFHLGDIHEGNFIFDYKNRVIRVVDTDSSKIGNNNSYDSRYLSTNKNILELPDKYPLDINGKVLSTTNTTVLCYVYMILNSISGVKIHQLPIEEYYRYLEFLSSNNYNQELLDYFEKIYNYDDNDIDIELLDSIPLKTEKVLYKNM